MNLPKRLEALERAAQTANAAAPSPQGEAIRVLVGAVYDLLPSDSPHSGGPSINGPMYPEGWLSTDDKVRQVVHRGLTGCLSDADQDILANLPAPALAVFCMTPLEWLGFWLSCHESV